MSDSVKRKSDNGGSGSGDTTSKKIRRWRTLRKGQSYNTTAESIESGDVGIWVTCDRNKEGLCTVELRDLFEEYALKLYGISADGQEINDAMDIDTGTDIEAEINKEVERIRSARKEALFRAVKIDVMCVLFFKVRAPVEPVSFVRRICLDASESSGTKRHRWIRRLTPMTRMGKATEKGLEEVSRAVLGPAFHQEGGPSKKFAIRPTIRNHNVMKRDDVIKRVADIVGDKHSVDLKNYDLLILVEIYRNVCGMSVVGPDFETLKRYNLAEVYEPTPRAEEAKTVDI